MGYGVNSTSDGIVTRGGVTTFVRGPTPYRETQRPGNARCSSNRVPQFAKGL